MSNIGITYKLTYKLSLYGEIPAVTLTQPWHMFQLVPKFVTDVTNEPKLMPLQFQVPSVSNWLGFKLLQFETKVAERGLMHNFSKIVQY